MKPELSRPAVTVATIVVRDGAFLLVEEETRAGVRLNQPAGHLEAGETLVAAAVRETLEETGYRVAPTALVGIYRWQAPATGATFIRFAFAATSSRTSRTARSTRASCARCGSPTTTWSRAAPRTGARSCCAASTTTAPGCGVRSISSRSCDGAQGPRDRRHVGRRRLVGRRVAAEAAGLRRRRPVHEELGGRRHRRILHVARGSGRRGVGRRRDRHRARGGQLRRRVSRARVRAFPARIRGRAARRTRTCSATARSSSARFSTTRARSAPTTSRPATTRGCAASGARRRAAEGASTRRRTRATSCTS